MIPSEATQSIIRLTKAVSCDILIAVISGSL